MNKIFGILIIMTIALSFASAGSYNIQNNNLSVSDINVFFSKNIVEANGNYNAWFNDSQALGNLNMMTTADDGSMDILNVIWSSEAEAGYGITITQDDNYAMKFIANAVVIHGVNCSAIHPMFCFTIKQNQQVYVHYNKLSKTFVVRGYGFRIENDI